MNLKRKLNSYILHLNKAKEIEDEIRTFLNETYGEEFYEHYLEDTIRDNFLEPDLENTLRLLKEIIREKNE